MQRYINSRVEKKVFLRSLRLRHHNYGIVRVTWSSPNCKSELQAGSRGEESDNWRLCQFKKNSQGKCSKEIIKYSEFFKIWQSMIIQDFCIQGKGFWTEWQICYGQSHWSEDEAKPFPFCVCHEVSYCITLIKPCYKISQVHLSKPVISLSATLINLAQLPACCLVHP